jgi:hypothetical protein
MTPSRSGSHGAELEFDACNYNGQAFLRMLFTIPHDKEHGILRISFSLHRLHDATCIRISPMGRILAHKMGESASEANSPGTIELDKWRSAPRGTNASFGVASDSERYGHLYDVENFGKPLVNELSHLGGSVWKPSPADSSVSFSDLGSFSL